MAVMNQNAAATDKRKRKGPRKSSLSSFELETGENKKRKRQELSQKYSTAKSVKITEMTKNLSTDKPKLNK